MKWNEMNRASGRLCAHIGWTGPGEPPEDGEMIEMTLSSRHRIRNSSPGGLRLSTLPLGHGGSPQYWLSHVYGEETFFVSFKPPRPGTEPRTLAWKAAVLTTTLGPPPSEHESGNKMYLLTFSLQQCLLIWLFIFAVISWLNFRSSRRFWTLLLVLAVVSWLDFWSSQSFLYYTFALLSRLLTWLFIFGSLFFAYVSWLWTTWHILKHEKLSG